MAPLEVVPIVPTEVGSQAFANTNGQVGLTYHNGVLPFRFVPIYDFPEIFTAETVVVLGAHRNDTHGQVEYEPKLQPKGMSLGGDIDNQLVGGNTRVKTSVS